MDVLKWLEPSIQYRISKIFADCECAELKVLSELISRLEVDTPVLLQRDLRKIEDAIYALLLNSIDRSYREGFLDARAL